MSRRLPIVQFQSEAEKLAFTDYFNALLPAGSQNSSSLFQFPSASTVQSFFRLSKLPKHVLQKIWDYVDQGAMTMFDQNTFNVGLRMISIAQSGQEPNLLGLNSSSCQVPRFAGYEHVLLRVGIDVRKIPWRIGRDEYERYKMTFRSLFPFSRPGDEAQQLSFDMGIKYFEQSGVNPAFLKHVWFLADYSQDMFLDFEEFCIAMHLISGLLEGKYVPLPNCLPVELVPPSKRGGLDESIIQKKSSEIIQPKSSVIVDYDWNVTNETRKQANELWQQLSEGKQILTKSCISAIKMRYHLADAFMEMAWSLVDIAKTERIDFEQFQYLLHMVEKMSLGETPPDNLPQELTTKFSQIPLFSLSQQAPPLSPRKTSITRRTMTPAASPLKPRNLDSSTTINPQLAFSAESVQVPAATDPNEANRRKSHYPSQYSNLSFFDQPAARELNPFLDSVITESAEVDSFMDLHDSVNNTPTKPKMRSVSTYESPSNPISSRIAFFDQIRPSSSENSIDTQSNVFNVEEPPNPIVKEQLEKLKRRNRILENCIREARLFLQINSS